MNATLHKCPLLKANGRESKKALIFMYCHRNKGKDNNVKTVKEILRQRGEVQISAKYSIIKISYTYEKNKGRLNCKGISL